MLRFAFAVLALALLLAAPSLRAQQGDGFWLDDDARARTDTLGAAPRLGEGGYGQDGTRSDAPSLDDYLADLLLRPQLDIERRRLQDLLRENRLLDDENASWQTVFAIDSTLALAMFQLRGEEYPHYHPVSDLWIYVWRGRGRLSLPEGESDYAPGDFIQLPAGTTHAFRNTSGAPTVALVWQRPPIVPELVVEFVPEDVLERMRLDSLRQQDLQERSLYRSP